MSLRELTAWAAAAELPALGTSAIQIWRIQLDQPPAAVGRAKHFLTAAELNQARRFRFPDDQRRMIVRRAVLRQLLAAYSKTDPLAIRLELGSHGKPFIVGPAAAAELKFSCTHSAEVALIAVSRRLELGVDLEQHRDLMEAEDLARNYFSTNEIQALAGLPPACKLKGFFDCWTRKEAFLKAVGLGLSYPLHRFSVSLAPDKPAALQAVADDPGALERWSMLALAGLPNFSAALVFEGGAADVKGFEWSPAWQG